MPVYNIPPSSIPTSSSLESPSVGVEFNKTLDDIVGNVLHYNYSISNFGPGLSKVVRTKATERFFFIPYKKSAKEFKYDEKLSQSISRTRRTILELALCNDWKWFGTFTIDPGKEEREDLQVFYEHFYEWLRYQREKTGKEIPYILVPEKHKIRGWHLHGFFNSDIDDLLVSFYELDQAGYRSAGGKELPRGLIRGGYYDWPAYRKRFGFCSFGKIRDKIACSYYITKYITKSLVGMKELQGKQSYYASQGLNKAVLLGRVYGKQTALDAVITRDYEFCSIGWFKFDAEPGWDPLVDMIELHGDFAVAQNDRVFDILGETDGIYLPILNKADDYPPEIKKEVDKYYKGTQIAIKEWYESVSEGSARL